MSNIEGEVILSEMVNNTEHKFGEQSSYFPVNVIMENGETIPALFTKDQIDTAVERAARNPEDIPKDESFWNFLFN